MNTFTIHETIINSEVKDAKKAIRQANKGLAQKVHFLPYEILYLPKVDHYALRVHYIDGLGKQQFYGIAI